MKRYVIAAVSLTIVAGLFAGFRNVQAQDAKAWGDIKGRIVWGDKDIPEQKPFAEKDITNDKAHCLSKGALLKEDWVVNKKNKGLKWTFVWLEPKDKEKSLPIHPDLKEVSKKEAVMDQPCCMFVPRALGMRQGQILLAKNSSPVPHNFNYTDGDGNGKNFVIPRRGAVPVKNLKADPYPITVNCNIHGWMKAWIRVFDHPYFAVTDENGAFAIPKAPAGDYQLMIWHEGGWNGGAAGRNGQLITIKGGAKNDLGDLPYKKPPT